MNDQKELESVEGKNLLISYLTPEDFFTKLGRQHEDPMISEFTYGNKGFKADMIRKKLRPNSYVFFHTNLGGHRYITAYYYVEKIMEGKEARKDIDISINFHNPHIKELHRKDDIIIFGDKKKSKDLRSNPLLFNRDIAIKLKLNNKPIQFDIVDVNGKLLTDNACIGSATRMIRELSDKDVTFLINKIKENEKSTINANKLDNVEESKEIFAEFPSNELFTLDEMTDNEYIFSEQDIEQIIADNPSIIEKGLTLFERQLSIQSGRIDLILQNVAGDLLIVEIKKNYAKDDVITQLLNYIGYIEKENRTKKVKGAIVCEKGVSPRLKGAAEHLGIDIYLFGLKFECKKMKI